MDPTNPENAVNPTGDGQQVTPDESNVQKRINELTAEKYAAAKAAEEAQKQVAQLAATVAEMTRAQVQTKQPEAPAFEVPEGMDPALAKFFASQIEKVNKSAEERAQQMFWQLQNQLDQTQVASKHGNLPPEVLQDAANRLTGLKQRYGAQNVTMDDAVGIAFFEWSKKQGMTQQRQQYNAMGGPLQPMGSAPNANVPLTQQLASPASRPDWDTLPEHVQWKLIDEWEKKGGKLTF